MIFCSIRRRALDLLYSMCDVSNAKDIVEELLQVEMNVSSYFPPIFHLFTLQYIQVVAADNKI